MSDYLLSARRWLIRRKAGAFPNAILRFAGYLLFSKFTVLASALLLSSTAVYATLDNTATVTGTPRAGTLPSPIQATETVDLEDRAPAFTITKSVDVTSITSPGTLTYTISIDNTGNQTLTTPVLTDSLVQGAATLTLSSGPTLVAATDADSDGELDVDETWEYTATYDVTQANIDDGADIVNTATFDTDETDPAQSSDPATATTTITTNPSLTIVKTATLVESNGNTSDGLAATGDVINYTYDVTNDGNITINNVSVSDAHSGSDPIGTPTNEALHNDGGASTGDSTDSSGVNEIWDVLAPGDTVRFTISYTVTQTDFDNQ